MSRCFNTKCGTISSHRDLRMIFAFHSILSFSSLPLSIRIHQIYPSILCRLKTCNFTIFIFKYSRFYLCILRKMPHQYSQPPHACNYRYLLVLRILFHNTLILYWFTGNRNKWGPELRWNVYCIVPVIPELLQAFVLVLLLFLYPFLSIYQRV